MYYHSTWSDWNKAGNVSNRDRWCPGRESYPEHQKQEFQPLHRDVLWDQNYLGAAQNSPLFASTFIECIVHMPLFCSGIGSVRGIRMRKGDGIMKRGPGRNNRSIYCYGHSFPMWFALLLLRRFSSKTEKEEATEDPGMAVYWSAKDRPSGIDTVMLNTAHSLRAKEQTSVYTAQAGNVDGTSNS
jgi:hypothetical protein